jgi:hypothetical protein
MAEIQDMRLKRSLPEHDEERAPAQKRPRSETADGSEQSPGPSLLGLPAEIRMQIMKELLVHNEPISFSSYGNDSLDLDFWEVHGLHPSSHTKLRRPRLLHPEILRTCSHINREARPLLYQNEILINMTGHGVTVLGNRYHDGRELPSTVLSDISRVCLRIYANDAAEFDEDDGYDDDDSLDGDAYKKSHQS